MWTRSQAVANCDRSKPFGHSAIGWRSVSSVGVIDDLSIHSSGPSPTMSRNSSVATCRPRIVQRVLPLAPVGASTGSSGPRVDARAGRAAPEQPHDSVLQRRVSQ